MWKQFFIAAAMIVFGWSANAFAAPIIYTVTSGAQGTLGNTAFNGPMTITAKGDTATNAACPSTPNCSFTITPSVTFTLPGVGLATLANPAVFFVDRGANAFGFRSFPNPATGFTFMFGNVTINDPNIPRSTVFASYDGASVLGPIATNGLYPFPFGPNLATDRGVLMFNGSVSAASFQAVMAEAVPEPATWAMMILGFSVIGAALRRRGAAVRYT